MNNRSTKYLFSGILTILAVISLVVIPSFAKFLKQFGGSDSARVAIWDVIFDYSNLNSEASKNYSITNIDEEDIIVDVDVTNESEVAAGIIFEFDYYVGEYEVNIYEKDDKAYENPIDYSSSISIAINEKKSYQIVLSKKKDVLDWNYNGLVDVLTINLTFEQVD